MERKTRAAIGYGIAAVSFAMGVLFSHLGIGNHPFFQSFGSLGSWLIYFGFVGLIIVTVRMAIAGREKIVDERMEFLAAKSLRITYTCIIIGAFVLMVADGIWKISIPYHEFLSYLVCAIIVVHFLTYRILLKLY
jgi:hypothetical protein